MKLIMENWKKFISEDTLEERQSPELRQGLNELSGWFSKWVFAKGQQKDQEQKFIEKYENSVYRKLQTEEDKATYIKKRDEKIAIAKQYLAIKAAEQKAQTPQDEKKIEQAEDNVDQIATQIEQSEEAEKAEEEQNLTPVKIVVEAISSVIGEQIGEKIVDPLVQKIDAAVVGGQAAAATATAATGGGASVPSVLFASALQGLKFFVRKFAKDKVKGSITDLITKTINDILSGFEETDNANEVLAKILGQETIVLVDAVLKQNKDSKDKINTIKNIIKDKYDYILKNIFTLAANKELGNKAHEYALKLINAKILGIPLGPFIGEMILGGEITEKLTTSDIKQELQQLADKGKEEAGESGEEPKTEPAEDPEKPADVDLDDLAKRFADFIKNNELLSESIGQIVGALEIKDAKKFGKFLGKTFTRDEIDIIDKLEGDDLGNFINLVKKALETETEIDPDVELEDEETVKVDGRDYTYTDEDVQELIKAYKNFIGEGEDDDKFKGSLGLMKVKTLRQQEQLWIGLRDALNNIGKFRPIIDQERALAAESINIHEAENTQKAKILVRDLERLRKDLNDTDSTLNGYIEKASGGKYEAAAYMARFLAELKDVQNSIGKTIEDTKNFVGVEPMQENLNEADEESREDKIQNVRNVYENIKDFLRSLPEIGKTTSAEYEEISGNIKRSYDELMKIRKYFRNVGAFAKTSEMDVGEIKEEYINIRKDLTKTMSSFIEDLRKGDIDKRIAASFMRRLAAVGDFILQTFDVGPDEGYGYKTIEVPSDETSKEEIAQTTSAEPTDSITGEEASPDAETPDPDEVEPEKTSIEQLKDFYNNNTQFYNVLRRLLKLIEQNDEESLDKLKELFPRLKQLKENEEFVRVSSPENMLESLTDIKNQLINLFEELRLIELQTDPNKRDEISKSIYSFATLMLMGKEMIDAEESNNISLINKIKSNIEGKVKQLVKSILSFTKEGEERAKAEELGASENTLDKLKKAAANFFNNFSKTEVSDDTDAESEENKIEENLLERLIRQELKVLNGKKMVRN